MFGSDILGMNARNLKYIRPHNSQRAMRLADDKLVSKKLLKKTGIKTPRLYGVISDIKDFEKFDWDKLPRSFVVKPNLGFGGEGILILKGKLKKKEFVETPLEEREWVRGGGETMTFPDLKAHVLDIVDGTFSMSGIPDTALFERKIIRHKIFRNLSSKGVPDVRVIVYNKVPVMAMLRLPTKASKGRANLFQGAIGLGVDVGMGVTTNAVMKMPYRRLIDKHPDTGAELIGFQVPYWDDILRISLEAQVASGIGFLGIDIAIDNKYGPEVLELNGRPGLEIQVANLEGLAKRLERVDGLKVGTVEKGVTIAKELFGGDIARRVEEVSGKKVLKVVEKIKVLNRKGTRKISVEAKVDTGADSTSISVELAKKLGYVELPFSEFNQELDDKMSAEEADKIARKTKLRVKKNYPDLEDVVSVRSSTGRTLRPCVKITFFLEGDKRISKANIIDRANMEYQMIIGRKDLKNYLIDPKKQ